MDIEGALESAACMLDRGDYDGALRGYESARAMSPRDERPLCGATLALMVLGRFDAAGECMHEALKIHPGAAYPLGMLGVIAYEDGLFDEALELYEEALRLSPGAGPAYVRKAMLLKDCGREKACKRTLARCRRIGASGGGLPKVDERLRAILGSNGAPEFKSSDYVTFMPGLWGVLDGALGRQQPPKSPRALTMDGILMASSGERAVLHKILDLALQEKPGSPRMLLLKGVIRAEDGLAGEALACYDGAIRGAPGMMIAYLHKCVLLQDSGDSKGVEECVRAALCAEPLEEADARTQDSFRDWLGDAPGERAGLRAFSSSGAVRQHLVKRLEWRLAPPVRRRARRRPRHRRMPGRGKAWEPGGTGLFPPGLLD